jgi:transposase
MWYAGIAWADTHHDALVIDEKAGQVGSLRVAHTPQGMSKLNTFLEQIIGTAPKEQMACIIETTHGLLIAHLLEAGWPVYPVNPRTVDRRRAASGAKTDTIDAYLLAKTGRADLADLHRLTPDSEQVRELKQLTRDQDALIQMQTRLVKQLTACLQAYYPVGLELFAKLHQRSTLVFLQTYPTPQAAMAASGEQIEHVLRAAKHSNPSLVAAQIVERLQQPHLQADVVTTRTKSRLMVALVSQLLPLLAQIAQYHKEIATLFLTHEDHELFASLGCIKPLRNVLHQFAWPTTQSEPWARDYYQRKRAEGKSHTVARRALANVWVRIIFAIWFRHLTYATATFEHAQQQHARPAA